MAPRPKTGGSSVGYQSVVKRKSPMGTSLKIGRPCASRKSTMAVSASTLTHATVPEALLNSVSADL